MISISQKSDCCGCRACEQVCPKSCITIEADVCGFLYPKVDAAMCINCGLCDKICPFLNPVTNGNASRRVFAMAHKNSSVIEQSSSGGAWHGICKWGVEHGYQIYGVVFNSEFDAVYDCSNTIEECYAFKRSKYVQPDPGHVFSKVKKELTEGKKVIFSGTPCFVKGLRNYLRKDYENLILIDLICHGIPSPMVWRKYLDFLEKRYKGKILEVNMRDKRLGWNHRSLTSVKIFQRGDVCDTPASNTYMNGFGSEIFYRPSCHQCRFASFDRPGDITIADFWDIEKFTNTFEGIRGVSCSITNSKKGERLISDIKDKFLYEERKISECLHPNLRQPTKANPLSECFWRDWVKSDGNFLFVAKKYFRYDVKSRMKRYIKRNLFYFFKK